VNFYKHHLGDYAAATVHLSWDEDCAYRRLMEQYYKREAPIPVDIKEACRLARAATPGQRRAVEAVLREFFSLEGDGWHQKRCDEEINAASTQAQTNRRIAEEREARRRERIEHESSAKASDESSTNRPPDTSAEREPIQTPDSRLQTPDLNLRIPDIGLTASLGQERPRANGSKPGGTEKIPSEAIDRVFGHWRTVHNHPRSKLDPKRRKLIADALHSYPEADLCQSISGYKNSPHHMGVNNSNTVYDDVALFLRDAKHIDAGLKFYAEPPRTDLSAQTRRIIDQTEDWVPPETRRGSN
jgi:uncharacterized protein YdaU (DUF1376 family)